MEVSVSVMLQIVTVAIACVTLVSDYIYKKVINKHKRTFSVVVSEMVEKLDDFRSAYSKILYYTNVDVINKYRKDNSKGHMFNKFWVYELNLVRAKVRTTTLPFWRKEVHLHKKMDELCKMAIEYYNTNKKSLEPKIKELRDEFFVESSIYDWAVWEYNQSISSGKSVDRKEIDQRYYELITKIDNSGSGRSLKFKEAFSNLYDYYISEIAAKEEYLKRKEGK